MYHLRDSLLSPSPRETSQPVTSTAVRKDQEDTRQSIARGEFKEIWSRAFGNLTWNVTSRYFEIGDGVDSLEDYIHNMWYFYFQLARHTSHEAPDQEGLVLDIIRIQGMGPLTRPVRGL